MLSIFSSFDSFFYNFYFFSSCILFIMLNSLSKNYKFLSIRLEVLSFLSELVLSSKNKQHNFIVLFLSSLFFSLFWMNYYSMWSFNFSWTSRSSFIVVLSISLIFSLLSLNVIKNFKSCLAHFVPEGSPLLLGFFLFLIEFISNLIRSFTLAIRLNANIVAGHLLMILLAKLAFSAFLPFLLYFFLTAVEFFVAFIQAYIFITLSSLYVNEV